MASDSSNANLIGLVDDFYLSALVHGGKDTDVDIAEDDELFPISDEKYAAELQLQEVTMSSAIADATARSSLPPRDSAAAVNNNATAATFVIGECSASSSSSSRSSIAATSVSCKTCMDAVPPSDAHAFCAGYVGAKIQDMSADVKCPEEGCVGVLDPSLCQDMLPQEVSAAAINNNATAATFAIGECTSSSSSYRSSIAATLVFCKICMDAVPPSDSHRASRGCAHAFCTACLAGYVGAKIQDRIADVKCPEEGCVGVLDPLLCQGMLAREVFERWCDELCESTVLGANRAYCPFKDCSAMMVMDDGDAEVIVESECPSCHRLFCAPCGVPWHAGSDCAAYRKLGKGVTDKEDMMLLEMAKQREWKRCPKCEFFVEKVDGCLHVTCRCGIEFCYGCGMKWGSNHSCCG